MEKILTIIVPTYNMEKYLDKCLSSLIVSDEDLMRQLEVLVVNDGSKDRSSEIAHGYEDRYPETYVVIDKENGNYGSCINAALPVAKGKYVKVLDADDWFDTEAFTGYLISLKAIEVDLVLNDYSIVGEHSGIERIVRVCDIPENVVLKEFSIFSNSRNCNGLQMHCVAYKTENLRKLNYIQTEGISYTDMEWVFSPMTLVDEFYYIPISLYHYLVGRDNQTMNKEVMKRKFRDSSKMTFSLFERYYYYKNKCDSCHLDYLHARLSSSTSFIYRNAIIDHMYDQREFDIFDVNISNQYPDFYKEMLEWTLPYHNKLKYIRYWKEGFLYFVVRFKESGWVECKTEYLLACDEGVLNNNFLMRLTNKFRSLFR